MRPVRTLLLGLTLATGVATALAACDNQPAKDKARAQVGEATPTPAAAAGGAAPAGAPLSGATHKFSQADSSVGFVGAKVTGKHEGSFGAFTGTIALVESNPEKSQVTAQIDATSLKADSDRLTGHLKSPDFFDVQKFPKVAFRSSAIKAGGDKGASHTVTGNLELHGVTRGISFPATIKVEGDAVQVNAEFGINRKDFGILYAGKADDLIKDEVLIKLALKAAKAAP